MGRGYPDKVGNRAGVYLSPDWAAFEGVDKNFHASDTASTFGGYIEITYTVPAGKLLNITDITMAMWAAAAADGNSNQVCKMQITVAGALRLIAGGNGGVMLSLRKPIVAAAGEFVSIKGYSYGNHSCYIAYTANGYEVIA